MKKKKKPKLKKNRNLKAISAHFRTSAGPFVDKKKERNKKKCRNKVKEGEE